MLSSLHADLPEPLLRQLAQLLVIELPIGAPVFANATRCGGLPLLLSGAVRVYRPFANRRSIDLYRIAPSEPCILSLGCLLGGSNYPACGITTEATAMVVMPPPMFDDWMANVTPFRTAIFRMLGERLVNVMQLVEEVTSLRLEARLAATLLSHAGPDGTAPILITHQKLADELGTVREMISRLLDDFARQGMLVLSRVRIELLAPGQLRKVAEAR